MMPRWVAKHVSRAGRTLCGAHIRRPDWGEGDYVCGNCLARQRARQAKAERLARSRQEARRVAWPNDWGPIPIKRDDPAAPGASR